LVNIMWSAGRYALLGTFLYASCSMGMQFSEPHTALDLAGPSDPFLPTTINPASDNFLKCQIRGRNCHRTRCEEAGARCLPSWTGSSCLQQIQFGLAHARSMVWHTSDQTRSACQDCVCQSMKTVKLEIKKTSRKEKGAHQEKQKSVFSTNSMLTAQIAD
jgi:hypothetical protein